MRKLLKKRADVTENFIVALIGVIAVVVSTIFNGHGLQQKWHAAIMWTGVAFGTVVLSTRKRLNSWRFWLVWISFLLLHVLTMWFLFSIVLSNVLVLGMLYVIPFGFLESILLISVMSRIENARALH
jgi:hypothetical protein